MLKPIEAELLEKGGNRLPSLASKKFIFWKTLPSCANL